MANRNMERSSTSQVRIRYHVSSLRLVKSDDKPEGSAGGSERKLILRQSFMHRYKILYMYI